MFIDFEPFV